MELTQSVMSDEGMGILPHGSGERVEGALEGAAAIRSGQGCRVGEGRVDGGRFVDGGPVGGHQAGEG